MNEDGYTKREHDLIFNDIREALVRIETQTTTTNGKVADITKWREQIVGGAKVAGVVTATIIAPIIIWSVITLRDLPNDIKNAVKDEISSKYDIQINK